MDIGTFIAASIAGGLGASLRWLVDTAISHRTRSRFPWGVLVVNVTGSFALAFIVTALTGSATVVAPFVTVVGAGLLGGYTTFSTVAVASVTLARAASVRIAVLNGIGTFVVCVLAALAGVACGSWVSG